jgi:hypothetical protein
MIKDPTKNPLNDFVPETPSTNSVKLPELPKLHAHIQEHGFTAGIQKHDEAMQDVWNKVEQLINERTQGKPAVSVSKP